MPKRNSKSVSLGELINEMLLASSTFQLDEDETEPIKQSILTIVIKDGNITIQLRIAVKGALAILGGLGALLWFVIRFILQHHNELQSIIN